MSRPIRSIFLPFFAALLSIAALAGCDRAIVTGRVLTVDGEALPGVVVDAKGQAGIEALSNTLGEYRLLPPAGGYTLRFSKSGYAPAESRVEAGIRESIAVDDVFMWRLPRNKGAYLYESARFIETTPVEPRTFLLEGDVAEFAIRAEPETGTQNTVPMILCYHMPRYEARVTRLRVTTAQLKQGQDYTFDVFAGAGTIPVRLEPVDRPEGMLMQVHFDEPLEPGAYALHWGAMIGDTVLEPRAYLFTVGAVEVAAEEDVTVTTEGETAEPSPEPEAEVPQTDAPQTEAPQAPDSEASDVETTDGQAPVDDEEE